MTVIIPGVGQTLPNARPINVVRGSGPGVTTVGGTVVSRGAPRAPQFGLGDIVDRVTDFIPGGGIIDTVIDVGGTLFGGGSRGSGPGGPPGQFGGSGNTCIPPFFRNSVTGQCELDVIPGPGMGGTGAARNSAPGAAVLGAFGAALEPGVRTVQRAVCIPGMVLGKDGLCYNKSQITNKQRMHPKARPPLLTGGERNAITKASRAAAKLERTQKQLQKIGLMKKPSRRRAPAPRVARALPAGVVAINQD